jgi:hypothetical protein
MALTSAVSASSASRSPTGSPFIDAGADDIDDAQANDDGRQAGRRVEEHRTAAEPAKRLGAANAGHAHDHGRGDQRHDQHLQRIDEQRADEVEHAVEADAEDAVFLPGQQARGYRDRDRDQDLPVQCERLSVLPGHARVLLGGPAGAGHRRVS